MILDILPNAPQYASLHPAFPRVFEFLAETDWSSLKTGRYDIDGDAAFALLNIGVGSARENVLLEAHRKYIDMHVTLDGVDEIGWTPRTHCTRIQTGYDAETDAEFLSDSPEIFTSVAPGHFAIYFPSDAHAPMTGQGEVRKIIVKIAV